MKCYHGVALFSLCIGPATSFPFGNSHVDTGGRKVRDLVDVPHFSALIARAAGERRKRARAGGQAPGWFDLNVSAAQSPGNPSSSLNHFSSRDPFGSYDSPSARPSSLHEAPGLQRPEKRREQPSSLEPPDSHAPSRTSSLKQPAKKRRIAGSSEPPGFHELSILQQPARKSQKTKGAKSFRSFAPWRLKEMHDLLGQSALGEEADGTRKSGNFLLYHVVMPDPSKHGGLRNVRTGEWSYYRKILDSQADARTLYDKLAKTHAYNPTKSISLSGGQKERYGTTHRGVGPAKHEEKSTTGALGCWRVPEWYRISPKPACQLPPFTQPWTIEDLRRNLVRQKETFPYHESGQKDSEYAGLDKEMRDMCTAWPCIFK